jgi:hypothetical protein
VAYDASENGLGLARWGYTRFYAAQCLGAIDEQGWLV